jgi:hypothetical protein
MFDEELSKSLSQSFRDLQVHLISKKDFQYLKQHKNSVELPSLYKWVKSFFITPSHTSSLVRVHDLEEFKQLVDTKTPVIVAEKLTEEAVSELPLRYPTVIYTLEIDNFESWTGKWKSRITLQ